MISEPQMLTLLLLAIYSFTAAGNLRTRDPVYPVKKVSIFFFFFWRSTLSSCCPRVCAHVGVLEILGQTLSNTLVGSAGSVILP